MKIPNWVPEVRRPWNEAYKGAWDAMSKPERQWSFLFDAALVVAVLGIAWVFH